MKSELAKQMCFRLQSLNSIEWWEIRDSQLKGDGTRWAKLCNRRNASSTWQWGT
ncbi:hypothetical protein E4U55_004239, partial [Claviceps digitariae]